ncbi:MAG: preprotein translocase subunit SecG [Puniceicoccales bacterium]|jgi:preprotein translocase subunit SecG|nr:preprotein translocase subunit SecG [Puniceicoccales bacterium]
MSTFFIFFLTSILLGICAFTVLLILMQRPSEESGMGATLGGGAATSVFGGEAVNVLAKITKYCVIIFFILSFILSMIHLALEKTSKPQNLLERREVTETTPTAEATETLGSGAVVDDLDADSPQNTPRTGRETVDQEISSESVENLESVD